MSGTQFDPAAVQAFLAEEATLREMVDAKCMLPNAPDIFGKTKHLIHVLERNKS